MKVLAYGEDPLTLDLLLSNTGEFLQKVADSSSTEDCLLLYRPSFGRGAGGCFGEFDAILASPKAIYLIEAKWDHSSEVTGKSVALSATQVNRHKIMRQYLEELLADENAGWEESKFCNNLSNLELGERVKVPKNDTVVAANIRKTADLLRPYGHTIIDVVLLFTEKPRNRNLRSDLDFNFVQMEYIPEEGNFYRLHLGPVK